MGALLSLPCPDESEPSLPPPGDEPICPGFGDPAGLLGPGGSSHPPWPNSLAQSHPSKSHPSWGRSDLQPQPRGETSSDAFTGFCECPFPGSRAGQGCPCMVDPEYSMDPANTTAPRRDGTETDFNMGHRYQKMLRRNAIIDLLVHRCDFCSKLILCFYHRWLTCVDCRFRVHKKCQKSVMRECASVRVVREPEYETRICPEVGLSAQNNRCAECLTRILPRQKRSARGRLYHEGEKVRSFKRCDYSGKYFCVVCIWKDCLPIPARVLRNWDWKRRLVSRATKQYLRLMHTEPVIDVEDVNPQSFSHVHELGQAKELRKDLYIMAKDFLKQCDAAQKAGLLRAFEKWPHLIEGPDLYSMQDLEQIRSKTLIKLLVKTTSEARHHIRVKCQTCRDKGQECVLCRDGTLLFPFDRFVAPCVRCDRLLHTHCHALWVIRNDEQIKNKRKEEQKKDREEKEKSCPGCRGKELESARGTGPERRLTTVEETPEEEKRATAEDRADGGDEDGAKLQSAARSIPSGGARRRVTALRASRGGSSTASPVTPRALPKTPMSDAWCRAIDKDRERDSPADRRRQWYAKT